MSPSITIGIIAPTVIGNQIKKAIKQFPTFVPLFKISDNIYDAPGFARELMDKADILLFSGFSPYKIAKDQVTFSVPAHYIPLTGNGLYRTLFRLKQKTSLDSLSVDTITAADLRKTLGELGEHPEQVFDFNSYVFDHREDMIEFHYHQYINGHSGGAITGIKMVSEALDDKGVPNEWLIPTYGDIVVSLERALLSTEKRKNKEAQVVVGLIKVNDFNPFGENSASENERQKADLEIHRMLLEYVEYLSGYLTNLGGNEYLFITTRGIFERETRGYKSIPILKEMDSKKGVKISIGVGFGVSANEAGIHARMALQQSKDYGGNICFIVRENRSVIGPVEMTDPLTYDLSVTDRELLKKAEKAGMTASYMSKIMAQINRVGKNEFTAQELSLILRVTVRSTHRILLKWLDAGVVDIVGEEKVTSKGRPRQIYRISFIDDGGRAKFETD